MVSSPATPTLDERLRLEGWSLHQRLGWVAVHGLRAALDASVEDTLRQWRQVVAPDNATNFDKRLRWDGLTPEAVAWALQAGLNECPQDPSWWFPFQSLRQAAFEAMDVPGLADRCVSEPFVHVWRPAAAWAQQELKRRCADLQPQLQLSDGAWLDLAGGLLKRLCDTADQSLWEQFTQRRTPGQMLLAHLGVNGDGTGEPVHEAYDAFVSEQLSSGYGLLLEAFPVLGRLLAEITQQWLEGSEEMLRRLATNRSALHQHFGVGSAAELQQVTLGLSDPHRGGRAVAILSFVDHSSDQRFRIVYKPKDMQVDQSFQAVLQRLNDTSILPPLRCLTVLSCDGYGFMEWVEHRPCSTEEELARFYTNAGRTMAILHLLGCTDCHYENLIACADQLVLIDTETLLEADMRDLISDDDDQSDAISDLQSSMQGSVMRSGLLPQWLMAGAGRRKRAFDVSALGTQPPQPEREGPGWLGLNSDGMMAGRITKPSTLPTSLPVPLGSPQRLTDFVTQLGDGFERQLQEVMRLRSSLLEELARFRGQPRRLVARATRLYFTIQRQMLEPTALRSAVSHGLKLEQLSRSFVLASDKPRNWPMFTAEVLQMEQLDIPFFEHPIDGEQLPLPAGLAPIPDLIKASGLAAAQRRLQQLDQQEIDFQQQLIRGSIATRHLRTTPASEAHNPGAAQTVAIDLAADIYRQEAFRLGEEVWSAAIRDRKGRPEWIGIDLGGDGESFHFGLIGTSLYSGTSGIALLFARLALACEGAAAERWRQRSWCCMEALAELAERNRNDQLFRLMRDLPYGIAGSGGILLALTLQDQAGISEAARLRHLLLQQLRPERLLADEGVDLIGGVTGLIGPLVLQQEKGALDLAVACGDRLLTLQLDNGGWPGLLTAGGQKQPLTGFSHGAAGMAAALARLAEATGEQRFAEAAHRAVAYERGVYVTERGNWPDFRRGNEPLEFMLSWCHGAPGILLGRQVLRSAGLSDAQTPGEIDAARRSTLAAIAPHNGAAALTVSHLCCEVLGLTSLLRVDAALRGAPLDPEVRRAESTLISQAQAHGGYTFFSVDTGSINLPGLLSGKAGVALALLEAADGHWWMPQILSCGLLALP